MPRQGAEKPGRRLAARLLMPCSFASLLLCDPSPTRAATPLRFPAIPPTPPEAAAQTFETLHGFSMQLIAAEPLVTDPVSVTYDEDGRAYICEMSDYPYTDKAHHKPSQENPTDQAIGKVRLLTDTDDDGLYDKATIFAADLSWPTGAACWKGGIIVVATPDIWYLKDTDGDGVADLRQKLFTGLKKLNVQAVANNPIWGLDNKIYIAGGSNGGLIQNLVNPEEKPLTLRRADLRLDPVTMKMELTSGGARFGNTRDDWGNRFLCNIRNPAQHVVIDLKYLARNPYLPPVNPLHDAAEAGDQLPVHRVSPPEAWRELRAQRWSAEGSKLPRSELVGSGVVTSSSGITCYRGDAYPEKFRGNLFVADVAANLFYRLIPEPDGVTFKANRSPEDGDKEFCASRDIWHRPVNFANAPDGTLTVCDMYREAIEHPWSLPDDIHAAIDLERGRDKGRLYRLVPPGFTRRKTPSLSRASTAELVKLLEHPNAWHRDTAHRLIFERQDKSAVPFLRGIALLGPDQDTKPQHARPNPPPAATVEALWLLSSMDALQTEDLILSLKHPSDQVQRCTIQISEDPLRNWWRQGSANDPEQVGFAVYPLTAKGETPSVRFQAMLTTIKMSEILGRLAIGGLSSDALKDGWTKTAILSSAPSAVRNTARAILLKENSDSNELSNFMRICGAMIAAENDERNCKHFLDDLVGHSHEKPDASLAGLEGFAGRWSRSVTSADGHSILLHSPRRTWIRETLEKQRDRAGSSSIPSEDRTRAVSLLTLDNLTTLQPLVEKLLLAKEPDTIRLATIQMLRNRPEPEIAPLLLKAWPTLTPAPREAAAQALASRGPWTDALLTAVEKQQIKPSEISPTIRASLQRLSNTALRDRAAKLFASSGTHAEVLAKYQSALTLRGDPAAGHSIYQLACAACHRKGTEGRDIGPNLGTVLSWSGEQLLTNILDPNREVSPNFLLYAVELQDGRNLAGMITSETATSLALKGADGMEQSVARNEVKSLKSTGVSLMPEGLEAAITPQQMADLMAYLRQ